MRPCLERSEMVHRVTYVVYKARRPTIVREAAIWKRMPRLRDHPERLVMVKCGDWEELLEVQRELF